MIIEKKDNLYEENQQLGYKINYFNEENNFYRISINNIKKLNESIKKQLVNRQPNSTSQTLAKPYQQISNKVKLKNNQLKVGNCKRQTEKAKKLYQGSSLPLQKQTQKLQQEINVLSREYQYRAVKSHLVQNISLADSYDKLTTSEPPCTKSQEQKIVSLKEEEVQLINRIESMRKEENHLSKLKSSLESEIGLLREETGALRRAVDCKKSTPVNLREAHAHEVQKLAELDKEEGKIVKRIQRQDERLEEQYRLNQQYKQRMIDRTEQENREIKVLREEIFKYTHQVKDIKYKYEQLMSSKNN